MLDTILGGGGGGVVAVGCDGDAKLKVNTGDSLDASRDGSKSAISESVEPTVSGVTERA